MIRIWPEETSKLWAPEFIFGVATAAYQIEGATQVGNRLPSIWDIYAAQSGRVVRNEDGYNACDHYHRWQSDIALIKDLGVDAYRLSLAWPRLINEDGRKNTAGLDFYKRLLDHLNAENISPFVTLYHWDLPQWMEERGGWTNREMIYRFTDYADIVSRELAGRVTAWTTFNEPWCSAYLGYATAEHAPGRTNIKAALQAAHHIMLAHGQACQILRQNDPQADVGIVLNLAPADAARQTQADQKAARLAEVSQNDWFLNPLLTGEYPEDLFQIWPGTRPVILEGDMDIIQQKLDFLGVNYYYRKYVTADGITGFREAPLPETAQRTTMHGLSDQVVFYRYRENYDPAQGRYISPWRSRSVIWEYFKTSDNSTQPRTSTSLSGPGSANADSESTFSVEWSRCSSLPNSVWTEDATFMGVEVLGEITAFFPSVTFFGPSTLTEIDALLQLHFS